MTKTAVAAKKVLLAPDVVAFRELLGDGDREALGVAAGSRSGEVGEEKT